MSKAKIKELIKEDYYIKTEKGAKYMPSRVPAFFEMDFSGILRAVAKDVKSIIGNKDIALNMYTWFEPATEDDADRPCQLCLAGAFMAGTLEAPTKLNGLSLSANRDELCPASYGEDICQLLRGLDALRGGSLHALLNLTTNNNFDEIQDIQKELKEAYREKWGSYQISDTTFWEGRIEKAQLPGLVKRINWIADWFDKEYKLV